MNENNKQTVLGVFKEAFRVKSISSLRKLLVWVVFISAWVVLLLLALVVCASTHQVAVLLTIPLVFCFIGTAARLDETLIHYNSDLTRKD